MRIAVALLGAVLVVSACPFHREACLEQVHPSWHACYDKSGCETARANPDGGPAGDGGGTEIVCGCCDER